MTDQNQPTTELEVDLEISADELDAVSGGGNPTNVVLMPN
jgi:hypothetical protein